MPHALLFDDGLSLEQNDSGIAREERGTGDAGQNPGAHSSLPLHLDAGHVASPPTRDSGGHLTMGLWGKHLPLKVSIHLADIYLAPTAQQGACR